jgi:hypothetical protein
MRPRAVPISFADLELQGQRLDVDVVLQQIGQVLDQQSELIELVRQDLLRNLRKPHTGRAGLTAAQTLRAYVLKQVKGWDLRELWTCPGLVDTYPLREEGGPNAQDTSTVFRRVPPSAR